MASTTDSVLAGVTAPYLCACTVTSDDPALDLSAVTAGYFDGRRASDGSSFSWAATLLAPAAGSLTLEHVFALGDVPVADTLELSVRLVSPLGTLYGTDTLTLTVTERLP